MTPVEIMAFIVIVVSVLKLAFFVVSPAVWFRNVSQKFYGNPTLFMPISLILAIIGLYYLTCELSIIQIFATVFVLMFLFAASFMPFGREMLALFEPMVSDKRTIWRKTWISVVVWAILIIWAICALVKGY